MAFHEIRLDPRISYGTTFSHEYRTKITELLSGDETRKAYWSKGRKKWTIKKELLSRLDVEALESFFRARKGMLYGFRMKDWNSYKKVDEPLPLLTNTTAQLQFLYNDAINPEVQIVSKPVMAANINNTWPSDTYNPDITLKRNTGSGFVDYASSGNWSIDRTTGLITFTGSQAGNTFKWSGSYDWPVRFNTDLATFQREAQDIHDWSDIDILELKQ